MAKRIKSSTAKAVQAKFFEEHNIAVTKIPQREKTSTRVTGLENLDISTIGLNAGDFGEYIANIGNCSKLKKL